MYKGTFSETLTGTPQGGIISPLLANIYLDELDKYMESNYLSTPGWKRIQLRRKGRAITSMSDMLMISLSYATEPKQKPKP